MSNYLSLDTVKKHIIVDADFHDDDDYIGQLMDVAEASVEKHLDIDLAALEDAEGNLPSPIVHAMMLMVGQLYMNREPVSVGTMAEIPLNYRYLIGLYQRHSIG